MFTSYQRYLAVRFIFPFVSFLFFTTSFLLTIRLFKVIRIIGNKSVSFGIILELLGHICITLLPMTVPISVLMAIINVLNKMSEDSEIVAMSSFGISKRQLVSPFLILGFGIALAIYSLGRNIIPYSKSQFKNTIMTLASKNNLKAIRPEYFFTDIPRTTLFAQKIKDNEMESIFLHLIEKDKKKIIFAKKGVIEKKEQASYPALKLNLFDGNIVDILPSGDIRKIIFSQYNFPIASNIRPGLVTKDSMFTNSELIDVIQQRKKKWKAASSSEKSSLEHNLIRSQLEYWSRISNPLLCLVFIFLGFCLGIKSGKEKSQNSTAMAIIILLAYHSVFFTGLALAKKGYCPPVVAVFLPSLIVLWLARRYYTKLAWSIS